MPAANAGMIVNHLCLKDIPVFAGWLYFFDIKTGIVEKLNPTNINKIIMRDNLLYSNYSTISNSKKKKTLYSYILKFNKNNPIYVNLE